MTMIDDIARRAASAARADAEKLAKAEADAGLARLRSGDAHIVDLPPRRIQPRRWVALAATLGMAAAAVVAVVLYSNHGPRASVVPGTEPDSPSSSVVDTAPPDSAPPDTEPAAVDTGSDLIFVDYQALPPALDLTSWATLNEPGAQPLMAIGDTRVVVVAGSTATLLNPFTPGADREPLQLDVTPVESIAAGPGDVLYAFVLDADSQMSIAAIALSGERAGQVVASAPVNRQFAGENVTNTGALAHGPDGIIDRSTGEQLLGYVDETGAPTTYGRASHAVAIIAGVPTNGGDVVIRDPDGSHDWTLALRPDPTAPQVSFVQDPGPYPSSHGGAVLWTPIDGSHNVIAVLASDGTGEWYTLSDGWRFGSSDVDGTLLYRLGGGALELARLDPPQRIDFLDQPAELYQRSIFAATLETTVTSARPCTVADLALDPGTGAAMGTIYGSLLVRNQGADVCQVAGVPDVALVDDQGNVIQSTDPALLADASAPAIVLEPNSWASAELGPISNDVCGGNASSQLRFVLDGATTTVPYEVAVAPVNDCIPPEQGGPGAMQVQAFTGIDPNAALDNPFNHLHITINAPQTARAGDVLRYDVVISPQAVTWELTSDACPIFLESVYADPTATDGPPAASAQLLMNCGDGVVIGFGEQVVFHMELPIPADAELGPALLTWTPVEPLCDGASTYITITA